MNAVLAAYRPARIAHTMSESDRRPQIGLDVLKKYMPVLRRRVEMGQAVYRSGQPFNALYLVNVGCLKTCELSNDGREQVTSFRMRGDLLGIESIGLARYACDVVALETSEIWELAYSVVLNTCNHVAELQARLSAALAHEIRKNRSWMLALGTLDAEARVAAFLLDMADRHGELGLRRDHFILRMCRLDMANYLAIKHETVSRILSHLHDLNIICVRRRDLRILDRSGLEMIAEHGCVH
jgi:CRP/FNR family transcriptional regulator